MNIKKLLLLFGVVSTLIVLILIFTTKQSEPIIKNDVISTTEETQNSSESSQFENQNQTSSDNVVRIENKQNDEIAEIKADVILENAFKVNYTDFSNYISPLEDIISKYDTKENTALMQEIFEIISNDLDTAEKISDQIDDQTLIDLSLEEKRSTLDRLGFYMITSPYVLSRLYSNLTPDLQAAVNPNWESESIVEPVVLKKVYEIEAGRSDEYEFKSKSPNNRYYKVIMEIANKDSELYKKQGNYVLYMYSNKEARHAEIEYVFCVDENDRLNKSQLAGSFSLKDL